MSRKLTRYTCGSTMRDDPVQRVGRQRETEEIGDSTATAQRRESVPSRHLLLLRPHVSFAVEADGAGMKGTGEPVSAVFSESVRACGWMAASSLCRSKSICVMSCARSSGIFSDATSRFATATTGMSASVLYVAFGMISR